MQAGHAGSWRSAVTSGSRWVVPFAVCTRACQKEVKTPLGKPREGQKGSHNLGGVRPAEEAGATGLVSVS